MKLKIVSDGTPRGTKILTEDGQELENVNAVMWQIEYGEVATCLIELSAVSVELEGEADIRNADA